MKRNIRACLLVLCIGFSETAMAADIACSSIDGEFQRCALPGADKMKVKMQSHTDGDCKFGQSWGVDREGIWVDMGCSGVFRYKSPVPERTGWRRFIPAWTH